MEAGVGEAEALGQGADEVVVGAGLAGWVDDLAADLDVAVAAGLVDVVVLQEHRRGQDDVGVAGGFGHEVFVHDSEQVVTHEAFADAVAVGADGGRVAALDEEGVDLGAAEQGLGVAGEDAGDAAHVEFADGRVAEGGALDKGFVPGVDAAVVPEGAAALVLPFAGDGGEAGDGVHGDGAVAAAGEAVAGADVGAGGGVVEGGEGLDFGDGEAGDGGGPGGRAGGEVGFEGGRVVGVLGHVGAVGVAVAEGAVHGCAGEGGVGAGAKRQVHVGGGGGSGAVGVDDDELGPPLLSGAGDVGHDVDLGGDGVGAPEHVEVGQRHFAGVGADHLAAAGGPPGARDGGADGALAAGPAHGVAEAEDAVAVDQAHGAGGAVDPGGFAAVLVGGGGEASDRAVERFVPGDAGVLAAALGAGAAHGVEDAVGVVHPLGVAGDLVADHPGGVGVIRAAHCANGPLVQHLDVEGAGAGAVVRADGGAGFGHGVGAFVAECARPYPVPPLCVERNVPPG